MKDRTKSALLRDQLFDLSVRYSLPLFPVNIERLVRLLPQLGYLVPEPIEPDFGVRSIGSGTLATKGEVRLRISGPYGSVAIRGSDSVEVLNEFGAIEDLLLNEMGIQQTSDVSFYELQSQAAIEARAGSPLKTITERCAPTPVLDQFASVLGQSVCNFSFRLVPPGTSPNSTEWFDVRIEPHILQPNRLYSIHCVFRNSERLKVFNIAKQGFGLFERLIRVAEGTAE